MINAQYDSLSIIASFIVNMLLVDHYNKLLFAISAKIIFVDSYIIKILSD